AGIAAFVTVVAAPPTATAAAIARRPEQLHGFRDDLGGVALLTFLDVPFAGLQTTLDIDRTPLLQVLAGNFRKSVEEHHAVPFGFLALLARRLVVAHARRGQRDVADLAAVGRRTVLGVSPKIAKKDHLVD